MDYTDKAFDYLEPRSLPDHRQWIPTSRTIGTAGTFGTIFLVPLTRHIRPYYLQSRG